MKILESWERGCCRAETQSESELDSGSESKERRNWRDMSEKNDAKYISITMDDLVYEKWA